MNDGSKSILVVLLMLSVIFNFYAYKQTDKQPSAVNTSDKILITVDKDGSVDFVGPKGRKPSKRYKTGHERPINLEKITGGKPVKTIDNITIFSYNPTCIWHDGYIICY